MGVQRLSNSGRSGYSYKSLIAGIPPLPSVPTIGTATALTSESASVEFTAPGAYSGSTYTATSSPGGFTASSATSPIVVTGLSEQTAYTFTVTATNATGTSGASAASNSVTTPAAFNPTGSMDALATVTVPSGGTSSITFAGLPTGGQYAHLQIRYFATSNRSSSNNDNIKIVYNSDTSAGNYTIHRLYGAGSSATSGAATGDVYYGWIGGDTSASGVFSAGITDILDYANSNKYKTLRDVSGIENNGSGVVGISSSLWLSTSAVNSIKLTPVFGSIFKQYSTFSIYGVKG